MKRTKWHLALIITSLIISAGLASGCMLAVSPQETASTANKDVISSAPSEAETSDGSVSAPATPPDNTAIGSDPVTGRNEEINMRWEQLCLSSEYQVQIAKDPGFTVIVLDTGSFAPASSVSPGAYYPAGGRAASPSSMTTWANLEAGHTYYWRARVRQAATGQQMLSPWSEVESFTVKSGFPTGSTSYGIQPIQPNTGYYSYPAKSASFSWSPLNNTTKYRFVLAKDAAMTEVVKDAVVTTTAYEYDGELEYSQVYFWRVMALEPTSSDWSAIFSFRTEAAPPIPAAEQKPTPPWVWPVVVIGLILLCVIIVLIFRMRR
ncbi:MAG: fibronectin type III domain-containing protein [Dehalococcoidia bacterium]|nr:fibronectin type III domain-containing protein [Dehalococcoidia bacterium]